jgi:hypothetical protein
MLSFREVACEIASITTKIMAIEPWAMRSKAPIIDATAGTKTAYLVSPRIFLMAQSKQ